MFGFYLLDLGAAADRRDAAGLVQIQVCWFS